VYEKGQAGAATSAFHPNSSTFLLALPPFSLLGNGFIKVFQFWRLFAHPLYKRTQFPKQILKSAKFLLFVPFFLSF